MNNSIWYDHFLKTLYEKYPKKSQLTEALMDLLSIEREAVYRRLRKEVTFSIYDIAAIANAWNISIDSIFNMVPEESSLFQMDVVSCINPLKKDIKRIENYLRVLKEITAAPFSEYMEISNTLPRSLFVSYPILARFNMFKWLYHCGNEKSIHSFNQFEVSQKTLEFGIEYYDIIKNITHISYMWDSRIIQHLINDVLYFESIYLLSKEEVQLIKQETSTLLDDMENLSLQGGFTGRNSKVDLYISQTNIDSNYYYFYSPITSMCGIRMFTEYIVASINKFMCENFRKWMHTQKRIATLISQVNERQRIEFFIQQREILNKM